MKTYERKETHPLGKEIHDAGPEPYSSEWYQEGDEKRKAAYVHKDYKYALDKGHPDNRPGMKEHQLPYWKKP